MVVPSVGSGVSMAVLILRTCRETLSATPPDVLTASEQAPMAEWLDRLANSPEATAVS